MKIILTDFLVIGIILAIVSAILVKFNPNSPVENLSDKFKKITRILNYLIAIFGFLTICFIIYLTFAIYMQKNITREEKENIYRECILYCIVISGIVILFAIKSPEPEIKVPENKVPEIKVPEIKISAAV